MALSEAIINKIKVLIYEDKPDEAEVILIAEAGLSPEEASSYIARLLDSLPKATSSKDKSGSSKVPAFVVLGISLLMWGIAAYFFIDKNQQINNSYLATGVVIDFVVNEGLAPVISYEVDGSAYQYISSIYSNPPAFELNESVEIYVNKDDPNDIIINSFINKWLIVTIFASFGLVFDLIGLLVLKLKSSGQSSGITFFDSQDKRLTPFDD
jgi:hypothetical protein